jgi:CRP/FNR family transcriptional regulator, cyclic AMP receptor protein
VFDINRVSEKFRSFFGSASGLAATKGTSCRSSIGQGLGRAPSSKGSVMPSLIDLLGYAASAAVLATFCMSTMIPLRILALGSNVLFASYGYFEHLYPVLILHSILFPINLIRLMQFRRLIRDVADSHRADLSIKSLLPYMTARNLRAGQTLVSKGERADRLYYLVDGQLEITDIGKVLHPGAVVGEIGVFARNQERTATIVSHTNCRLYELSEQKAKELYFQDRPFGFAVLQLIISRLLENNRLLQNTRLLQNKA